MPFLSAGVAAALVVSFGSAAQAQSSAAGSDTGNPAKNSAATSDRASSQGRMAPPSSQEFVTKATQSNLAEIKTSQLALSKTQNSEVRSFAQNMIDDHTKANSQLQPIAAAKNLKVPEDTDLMHKAAMKLLQTKSGEEFDSAYIKQMRKDHDKTIELFQAASTSEKLDQELRALASKTLPKLEQHRSHVTKLETAKSAAAANQ